MTKRTMSQEDFTKWSKLTHAVVRRRFWWAYWSKIKKIKSNRLTFEYDDLVAEGNLAAFQTYAFQSIYNRVWRFIETNSSVLTGARGNCPQCTLFGEYEDEIPHGKSVTVGDTHVQALQDSDWTEHCIGILRDKLGKRKTKMLIRWVNGDHLKDIGKTLGVTREWARLLLNEWIVEAVGLLSHLEEESHDK
jgi:hypothetical protein